MASLVDSVLAYALGAAFGLGIWLLLVLGSYLLWQALSRWSIRHVIDAMPHSESFDRTGFGG